MTCEPGQEDNLHPYPCATCEDEMLHLCEAEGVYPLCVLWQLECGECGTRLLAWEERAAPIRMAGMGRPGQQPPQEEEWELELLEHEEVEVPTT